MGNQKQKYLFMYLKTGGGHIAPARAVANYIHKNFADEAEVHLIDGFEKTKRFAKFIVEDGYRILQSKTKWIYELIYAVHKFEIISHFSAFLVSINMNKYLTEIILNERPDKIVLFHFFLIKPVYKILTRHNLAIPVITVVTDPYTAHPIWFLRKKQNFIVFSEKLKNYCVKKGINEKYIEVFPFVLDEKFSGRISQNEISVNKNRFGFTNDKILLIMGGGDGIPNGIRILKSILNISPNYGIAFVCGKNKIMYNEAIKLREKYKFDDLKIFGFIDFVHDLLGISDVVITKCGASTFMEILLSNKIPVVNSYIWEQEKGNVDFLVENGIGIFEKRIGRLPLIIKELFSEKDRMEALERNISKAGLKNGTPPVSLYIHGFGR